MILDSYPDIYQEWPFTCALPAQDVYSPDKQMSFADDDKIIVQGVIDLFAKTNKGLVIIDFKTDHITSAQINDRASQYKSQLNLYSKAAQLIFKTPVFEKYLYFTAPAKIIKP